MMRTLGVVTFVVAFLDQATAGGQCKCACATTKLKVRSKPSTSYPVLYTMSAGECLPYRGVSQTGSGYTWYGVTYKGSAAWAKKDGLNVRSCSDDYCACATDDLNVRREPSTSSQILHTLSEGECLSYRCESQTGSGYTWYGVTYRRRPAWAKSNWLKIKRCV